MNMAEPMRSERRGVLESSRLLIATRRGCVRAFLLAHPCLRKPLSACDPANRAKGRSPPPYGCTGGWTFVKRDSRREACCDLWWRLDEERFRWETVYRYWDGRVKSHWWWGLVLSICVGQFLSVYSSSSWRDKNVLHGRRKAQCFDFWS